MRIPIRRFRLRQSILLKEERLGNQNFGQRHARTKGKREKREIVHNQPVENLRESTSQDLKRQRESCCLLLPSLPHLSLSLSLSPKLLVLQDLANFVPASQLRETSSKYQEDVRSAKSEDREILVKGFGTRIGFVELLLQVHSETIHHVQGDARRLFSRALSNHPITELMNDQLNGERRE